ncbi:interferon-induced 6-16 family protein [Ceratobasidium sp. AG-Ba]|nr:interferon-induced 6-16 family protein [Ceratobasidium sp. AG-Ba]
MNDWFDKITNDQRIRAVHEKMSNLPPSVQRAAKVGATGVAVGATVFAIPPLLGFTTAGVAAGSIAAGIQSAFYGGAVSAGSAFAVMQSIGATATIIPALFAGVGAAAGATVATEGGNPPRDGNDGEHLGDEEGIASAEDNHKEDSDDARYHQEEKILLVDDADFGEGSRSLNEGSGQHDIIRSRNNSS